MLQEYTHHEGEGERGLIGCECCVRGEENSLSWYILNSREVLLRKIGDSDIVYVAEAIGPNEYKRFHSQKREDEWKQKIMHGQFLRDKDGMD